MQKGKSPSSETSALCFRLVGKGWVIQLHLDDPKKERTTTKCMFIIQGIAMQIARVRSFVLTQTDWQLKLPVSL